MAWTPRARRRAGRRACFDDDTRALVPLITGDTVTGHLGLTATGAHRYDADDLEFFTIVAGRVALVLANARLVTDLKSTQARLDGILNSLAEAVTVNDDQGRTVYANPAATRLLGLTSPEEVIARAARASSPPASRSPTSTAGRSTSDDFPGRRLVRGEPAPELLTRTIDKASGRAYWLLTKASLLEDQGRKFAVNIIEDVTEAKEAEQRQRFLAQAGQLLASSLDYEQTLKRVARARGPVAGRLVRRRHARRATGRSSRSRSRTSTREKIAMAEELRRRYPPEPDAATGVPAVLSGGAAGAAHGHPGGAARRGDRGSRAARGDQGDRHALGDGRPDARGRGDARRDHVRDLRQRSAVRRGRLRVRPGPRAARGHRGPERPPLRGAAARRAHAAGQPAARRAAGRSPATRSPPPTRRASSAPTSAATSTTSSPRPTRSAARRSSAMSPARASTRPR